jgi:hypothetical protein
MQIPTKRENESRKKEKESEKEKKTVELLKLLTKHIPSPKQTQIVYTHLNLNFAVKRGKRERAYAQKDKRDVLFSKLTCCEKSSLFLYRTRKNPP